MGGLRGAGATTGEGVETGFVEGRSVPRETAVSPHNPSASESARSNGGLMCNVGQKTRMRLLRGIFVTLLALAVTFTTSTTVFSRSLFS